VRDEAVVVVGSTVAALAAADALARAGRPVVLYAPRQGYGAGFSPLQVGGRTLPLGFRVLELVVDADHPRPAPPITDYRVGVGAHREWLGMLDEWFAELIGAELRELAPFRMWAQGRLADDIYYATDVTPIVTVLSPEQREAIRREVSHLQAVGGPAGLLADPSAPWLWTVDLPALSLANHGPTFHELFIESVCRKITAGLGVDVPGVLRRKMWTPVFWPETLAAVLDGHDPRWRPTHRRFHDWGGRDVVSALGARLSESSSASVVSVDRLARVTVEGDTTVVCFGDGTVVRSVEPILALGPQDLFNAAGASYRPERLTSVLAWLEVAERDLVEQPGCVMVADSDVDVLRISFGGTTPACGHRLVTIELAHDVAAADAPRIAASAVERMGLVTPGATVDVIHTQAGTTLTAPTRENHRRYLEAQDRLFELGSRAHVIAGSASFGADSLNEQVTHALCAAEMVPPRHVTAAIPSRRPSR
jgi:hypothetical protein